MKKSIKKKWINALVSGEYKQGSMALCRNEDPDNETYCCLGVLYDVAFDGYWVEPDPLSGEEGDWRAGPDGSSEMLTTQQLAQIGMSETMMRKLTVMNDRGETFKNIAAYIERHL